MAKKKKQLIIILETILYYKLFSFWKLKTANKYILYYYRHQYRLYWIGFCCSHSVWLWTEIEKRRKTYHFIQWIGDRRHRYTAHLPTWVHSIDNTKLFDDNNGDGDDVDEANENGNKEEDNWKIITLYERNYTIWTTFTLLMKCIDIRHLACRMCVSCAYLYRAEMPKAVGNNMIWMQQVYIILFFSLSLNFI